MREIEIIDHRMYIYIYMHTQGDNLPHQDSKAPHVRFGGEERVDQRLGRHPPYRQRVSAMSRLDHLSIPVRESGHTEVSDLAQLVVVHEHVPRGEIAVDDLQNRIKTHRLDQHSSPPYKLVTAGGCSVTQPSNRTPSRA